MLGFLTKTALAKAHAIFTVVKVVDTDATIDLRVPCLGAREEGPLYLLPGWIGLQGFWLHYNLPGGQLIQPGNEAELSFMEMILIMRHGSKEEEATDDLFSSPYFHLTN